MFVCICGDDVAIKYKSPGEALLYFLVSPKMSPDDSFGLTNEEVNGMDFLKCVFIGIMWLYGV